MALNLDKKRNSKVPGGVDLTNRHECTTVFEKLVIDTMEVGHLVSNKEKYIAPVTNRFLR